MFNPRAPDLWVPSRNWLSWVTTFHCNLDFSKEDYYKLINHSQLANLLVYLPNLKSFALRVAGDGDFEAANSVIADFIQYLQGRMPAISKFAIDNVDCWPYADEEANEVPDFSQLISLKLHETRAEFFFFAVPYHCLEKIRVLSIADADFWDDDQLKSWRKSKPVLGVELWKHFKAIKKLTIEYDWQVYIDLTHGLPHIGHGLTHLDLITQIPTSYPSLRDWVTRDQLDSIVKYCPKLESLALMVAVDNPIGSVVCLVLAAIV